jgi:hypothetical protein
LEQDGYRSSFDNEQELPGGMQNEESDEHPSNADYLIRHNKESSSNVTVESISHPLKQSS